jgi:hypothetical protein
MVTAGRHSSGIFRLAYPKVYADTGYGRLDGRDRGILFGALAKAVWIGLEGLMPVTRRALDASAIPFAIRQYAAKLYSACAFAYGTVLAKHDAKRVTLP